jgi:hypothetical protein
MTLLRRTLGVGALFLLGLGGLVLAIPRTIVEGVMDQAPAPEVWLRLFGAATVALGLFHVLILRKLDELWWWCWAVVVFDALSAIVAFAYVAVGVPEGSASWPWWTYGVVSASFAIAYLAGIGRAGQERPLV